MSLPPPVAIVSFPEPAVMLSAPPPVVIVPPELDAKTVRLPSAPLPFRFSKLEYTPASPEVGVRSTVIAPVPLPTTIVSLPAPPSTRPPPARSCHANESSPASSQTWSFSSTVPLTTSVPAPVKTTFVPVLRLIVSEPCVVVTFCAPTPSVMSWSPPSIAWMVQAPFETTST